MRVNIAVPEENVRKAVLDPMLESVTRLNEQLIRSGRVPLLTDAIKAGKVRWKPEPKGWKNEHFDHAEKVIARGWGDCDDLGPWHAASLRVTGNDEGAFSEVRRSGPSTWHAIVKRSDGSVDDPSRWAGMGRESGVSGAVVPSMSSIIGMSVSGERIALPQVAARPRFARDGLLVDWEARVDLPWNNGQAENVVTHRDEDVVNAVVGALRASSLLAELGEVVGEDLISRADAMADWSEYGISGEIELEELVSLYGDTAAQSAQSIGSFWDTLTDVASKAVSFVPGVGPIASMAIDAGHGIAKSISESESRKNAAKRARKKGKAKRSNPKQAMPKGHGGGDSGIRYPSAVMKPGGEVLWRYV